MTDLNLDFNERQSHVDAAHLPLAFGETDKPRPIRRSPPCYMWRAAYSDSCLVAQAKTFAENGANVAQNYQNSVSGSLNIQNTFTAQTAQHAEIHAHLHDKTGESELLFHHGKGFTSADAHLSSSVIGQNGLDYLQIACAQITYSGDIKLRGCLKNQNIGQNLAASQTISNQGKHVSGSLKHPYGHSVQPPCYWRDIPLDDTSSQGADYPCGKRPDAAHLPLEFDQLASEIDSAHIPLPFACKTENFIPNLPTYIMLNEITAKANGRTLSPFSASIAATMDGYCWLGEVSLPPDDFAALELDKRNQGNELEIELTLNGEKFVFLAEQVSDGRQFGQKTYTVSGRSPSAHLGADYAQMQAGVVNQGLYAQQIAAAVLYNTGFNIGDWHTVDWLVPANVYSLNDKTPIAVLQDIAAAAGAFLESDPSERKIHVRPRWKKAAWEIGTASNGAADVRCPADIIIKISGQKQVQTQYKSVFAYPTHELNDAGLIYRSGSDKMPQAPMLSHALYTESKVQRAAGLAALSDSGVHKTETVEIAPPSAKYAVPRAKLGQIWRFDEPDGAWFGVITGVKLTASVENNAPKISQTLTVDRYLGD
ncbi:hypothetical protein [Wielerella bovis]|uniref:hypothetical protein n=1 Tax=Wielerella bovis TaxID=2917790 RepID=UPI002018656D|nr:hypothetical protein [Wielerella bovis]MCG7655950.1 hypothetical protein [Wielerella bovis]MCG7655973.1 hypothetical protein [Wielerella bovis]MCG7656861.1 hypothetical protein [Wielerella bovis]MCG7658133.1 hypothetical protein [Wielerella bovis]MCG7658199.1 hypothetical protein [Wielerella bovis]